MTRWVSGSLAPTAKLVPVRMDSSAIRLIFSRPTAEADPGMEAEGFFDLAQEIEKELTEEASAQFEMPVVDDGGQPFHPAAGIRRAIEDQVDDEDHQTHYQLGIAFKEMGMLDEAIGEFQQASRHRESFLACCSMLGLCFQEKRMEQIAEKWYRRGLEHASSVGKVDSEVVGW